MKQKNLAIGMGVALLITCQFCKAQKNVLVGIQGGASIASLTAGSTANPFSTGFSPKFGGDVGLLASFWVKKKFSIQVEFNYSAQGANKKGAQAVPVTYYNPNPTADLPAVLYANLNTETKLNYFQLPVLAKLSWPLKNGLSFFVNAGPYASVLISAKTISSGVTQFYKDAAQTSSITQGQSYTIAVNEDVKDNYNALNVGVQGGLGLQQKLYKGFITLTAGGSYGFIPVQKNTSYGQNNATAGTVKIGYVVKL